MIRIRALNDSTDSSDSQDSDYQVTREVEEEKLNGLYMSALKFASAGDSENAIQTFEELKNELESDIGKIKDAILLSKLKYLTYKNLGLLKSDLNLLLDALEIDDSDLNLWITTGRKGKERLNYLISKYCFERAFQFNNANFIVIDNLIDIYFIINDLSRCVQICLHSLEIDSEYLKAKIILNHCIYLMPTLFDELKKFKCHISPKFGGEDYSLLDEEIVDYSDSLLRQFSQLKKKRLRTVDDDEEKESNKKRQFVLNIEQSNSVTFSEIGVKIKKLFKQIQSSRVSICSPICFTINSLVETVDVEMSDVSQNENVENSSIDSLPVEAVLDEKAASNVKEKKPKEFNIYDFADKRRSSRVRGKNNKSGDFFDDQSITDSLFELLPVSLKNDESGKSNDSNEKEVSSDSSSEHPQVKPPSGEKSAEHDQVCDLIEKFRNYFLSTKQINIFQLMHFYLVELSTTSDILIPDVFREIYKLYRQHNELPYGFICEIGKDINVDSIIVCLTANELEFDRNEILFLHQILSKLSSHMKPDVYRQFVIRFLVLCGAKEFNNDYLHFASDLCSSKPQYGRHFDIFLEDRNEETDVQYQVVASNKLVINSEYIDTLLDMQSISIENLSNEEDYSEVIKLFFTKSEKDLSESEKSRLNQAIVKAQMWQKGVELFECWTELTEECLATILECVQTGKRARISSKLTSKIIKHAMAGKSVVPWLILYWSFIAEGVEIEDSDTPLVKFFELGHNFLGKKGLCTGLEGQFLLLAQKVFTTHEMETEASKCFSCLFDFPARKHQHPSDHHPCSQIEFKWEHCEDIYNYFAPDYINEFDSRQSAISQEMKDFFLKILRLIPEEKQPFRFCESIKSYISQGKPLNLEMPACEDSVTSTIFYLLADYSFKAKDFAKAKQFYIFDLALNVNRFDAWAGLALSINYQLDQILIEGNEMYSEKFVKTAFSAIQCFEQALRLQPGNNKLWIEFGIHSYNVASNFSRKRKLNSMFNMKYPNVNNPVYPKYEEMLMKAKQCFEKVLHNENENDELWLSYYMLGKVSEKNKENIFTTLQHYEDADMSLYLEGATYPKKLPYYNPPNLSVEALEIHYRIHTCILKYLINNRKFSARSLRQIKYHLIRASRSPFVLQKSYSNPSRKQNSVKSLNEFEADLRQVHDLLVDIVSIVSERDVKFDVNRTRNELIAMCVMGIKRCISRYNAHYKSYYRLAYYFNHVMDFNSAKSILLGGVANKYNPLLQIESDGQRANFIAGLFVERKPSNLYNGIWRIPIDEIERAGNFNSHMFRCTNLLITICTNGEDYQTLTSIAIQLHRTPDSDKRFLNEDERLLLCKTAFNNCFNIFATLISKVEMKQKLVEEIQSTATVFIHSNVFAKETIHKCNLINEQLIQLCGK